KPALAPRLEHTLEALHRYRAAGGVALDYANGCIEDPRLIRLEGKVYLTVATRIFPPGPYWEHDDPMQCAPDWARSNADGLERAVRDNLTVNVLYEVDLERLAGRDYEQAFIYLGPITDPERGDNRDAFLFPEKLKIDGRLQYVCVHRPRESEHYPD